LDVKIAPPVLQSILRQEIKILNSIMPYTIDGTSYKEIAERRFAQNRSLNRLENPDCQLPFTRHTVQHTYSRDFGIIRFSADFQKDLRIAGVRDQGHVSLHFQRKGFSKAVFRGIKEEHPLAEGEYNLYFSEEFFSNLEFNRQTGFEYLAVTLQTDYLLSVLEQAGPEWKGLRLALQKGTPLALSEKAMPVTPELHMALYSLLHTPVAEPLAELFFSSKVAEIIALQLSQYSGTAAMRQEQVPGKVLKEVYEYINQHFLSIHSPADAVKHFPLTVHQLKQGLKQHYHTTLYELVHHKRMLHAMQLLKETEMNVNEVAWETGYSNATNFIQAFKRSFSITPRQAKAGR
jgi:AraC-like DNA-binding protein